MRWLKNAGMSILILFLMAISGSQAVSAAEEAYTYTVRLYAGNQGTITNSGVEISSSTARISFSDDCAVISGLQYGDMVYIRPQDAIETTDERYYVRGVRRSGRDNAQAESPAFYVACDRDFVAAYGVRGDMAEYTVSYQDEAGNTLMKSDTYYGNIGERQYVSSRYIEGYQPSYLNMVKTLSANAAENIFTFRYTRIAAGTTPAPGGTTTTATTGTTTAGTTTTTTAAGGGTPGAQDADAGAADAQDADAAEQGGETPPGGDANVPLPDDNVPLDQQELENLDDGEVPLADIKAEQAGLMGYFPIYAGIAATAAAVLAVAVIYLYKRKKTLPAKAAGKDRGTPDGSQKP